nr:amidohydrolase family protein [Synergistales bacterium]
MKKEMSSPAMEKEMLYRTCRRLASEGITSAHTCGTAAYGLEENITAYVEMHQLGRLALRIVHYSDKMPEKGIRSGHGDEWISYGGYKMFLDGSLGGRTAALTSPYEDQWENMGMLNLSQEEVTSRMREAHERGIQTQVHAIGDAAIDQFIRALRSLKGVASPKGDLRHRIVHLQVCRPDQIVELRNRKAICDIQPVFVPSDIDIATSRLGKWRSGWAYPWRDMLSSGLHLNGSSDAPVEPTSPLRGIWAAINRTDDEGEPVRGWRPDQCLTLEETLPLFTSNPPISVGRGNQLGRISEGFLADMVILDRNIWRCPPQEIKKIKPLFTFVDGKLSHGRIEDWPSVL